MTNTTKPHVDTIEDLVTDEYSPDCIALDYFPGELS